MLATRTLRKAIAAGSRVRAKSAIARRKRNTAESSTAEGSTEDYRLREAEDGQTTHARIAERRNDKRP